MNALFVLLGPTGVGKTDLSINIARLTGSPIISADSRQIYREMTIGTAAPDSRQLDAVKHYFIGSRSIADYYSAAMFEEEALALIEELHPAHPNLLLCGGSMMYIDAVCKGIDEIPTVSANVRTALWEQFQREGLAPILEELKSADPVHYNNVDRQNYRRIIHAVEICRMTGKPYSSFLTKSVKNRPFRIFKIGLMRERAELFERINCRVDAMIAAGFVDEARNLYAYRHLNALNTVGYKELFRHFDGDCTLDEAAAAIKRNTRIYARKQMTWFKRDNEIVWFHPDDEERILQFVKDAINAQ